MHAIIPVHAVPVHIQYIFNNLLIACSIMARAAAVLTAAWQNPQGKLLLSVKKHQGLPPTLHNQVMRHKFPPNLNLSFLAPHNSSHARGSDM